MEYNNRINRLSAILVLLSKGYDLSTPELVEKFGVTKKIIQTDFKEYLLPLFNDDKIFVISTESPLAKAMSGKSQNAEFSFNNNKQQIVKIW